MIKQILFYLVVFISNIIQSITGFAGTVLAMPFSVMLVGFETAKPILNILGIFVSAVVVARHYRSVDRHELLKIICFMGMGMVAGIFISPYITGDTHLVYIILGVVVISFAVYNSILYFKKKDKELSRPVSIILLISAGLVHGLFVCGGPLLVTYASSKIKDTQKFRATLSASWIILNTSILISDFSHGLINIKLAPQLAICVVLLIAAVFIGEKLANKMSKKVFMIISYALMLYSGASLCSQEIDFEHIIESLF